jgi:hypothetical protein
MAVLKRALRIAAGAVAGLTYLWFAGVRLAPLAKWRRAAKAAARRAALGQRNA